MISFNHQERVHAPVEAAFEFGLNPDNWLRQFRGVEDYELIEDAGNEKEVRIPYRLLWIPMEFHISLRVVEPNHHIAVEIASRWMVGEAHYYYTEIDEGTLIEAEGEYEFRRGSVFVRLLEPVLRYPLDRKRRNAMREEKRLIEAAAADQ